MNQFTIHACEQVLRFSQAATWNDLSEATKVQLGFNMGAMALGLALSKEEGFQALTEVREGTISMQEFRTHVLALVEQHQIPVQEENITRPF